MRALQQHASEVVRRVAAGEIVEVTDRGRPVARLVPIRSSTLETLIEAGAARPARIDVASLAAPLKRVPGPSLNDLLSEARADER